jgi:hypothetical protein
MKSRLIEAPASPEIEANLLQLNEIPGTYRPVFMVFETVCRGKTIYICLSGGRMVDGEPELTITGSAAFDALIRLPGDCKVMIFKEVKIGKTPLREKVEQTIMDAPEGARICFFGDMWGELDGVLLDALNMERPSDDHHRPA